MVVQVGSEAEVDGAHVGHALCLAGAVGKGAQIGNEQYGQDAQYGDGG